MASVRPKNRGAKEGDALHLGVLTGLGVGSLLAGHEAVQDLGNHVKLNAQGADGDAGRKANAHVLARGDGDDGSDHSAEGPVGNGRAGNGGNA